MRARVLLLVFFASKIQSQTPTLDLQEAGVQDRNGVQVHNISYSGAGPPGTRVSAWLVIPKWEGRFGAILFGHWMMKGSPFSNRDEFLGEAVLLARSGAVSLLIEAPEQESIAGPRQVIDFRRGLDLLLARPDVDPERIAYVGHGFNAQVGAILATVEKRIQSFVLMAGAYDADSPVHSSPAALFLQLAGKDQSRQKAKQYFDRFDEPKRIQIYDGGHALNADARRDRVNWLVKRLALRPIDDAALMSIPQLK